MEKHILLLIISFLSLDSFSQCTSCTSLQEALKKPEIVKILKMNGFQSGIHLSSVPPEIGLLTNIEILYLSDQDIKTIAPEIRNLTKLRELSLAGCELESLPEEIFTLTSLKEIILFDNPFTSEYKAELQEKFARQMPRTKVLIDME